VASRPSVALIVFVLLLAVASMAAGVYFGGTGRTPLAMLGTLLFVGFGGLAFELARRRSL
jgi:hypothetical protein